MAAAPRLTTFRFRVFGGDPEEPESHEVLTFGRDIQRTEKLFADKGWGGTTSRPMTSAAACVYFAMTRMKKFSGTWDEFEDWYLSVETVEPVSAVPTEAAPEAA